MYATYHLEFYLQGVEEGPPAFADVGPTLSSYMTPNEGKVAM